MADKLRTSLKTDNFNRWKVDHLKKNYKRQLIELSVNSYL